MILLFIAIQYYNYLLRDDKFNSIKNISIKKNKKTKKKIKIKS